MRLSRLSLIAGFVVLLGACGGSDDGTAQPEASSGGASTTTADAPATTTATEVDACVLVDADDAARILGSPATVDTTPIGSFGETSVCSWVTDSDALLVVSLFEGRQYYGGADIPGAEAHGIGDEGYIVVEETFGGVDLRVVKGEWVLSLSAAPFGIVDVPNLPAAMKATAQTAVDRLPDS